MIPKSVFPNWQAFTPAFAAAELPRLLDKTEKAVAAIEASAPADYEHLIGKLNDATRDLWRVWGAVSHLLGVMNAEAWRKLEETWQPKIVAFSLRVGQSQPIYAAARNLLAQETDPTRHRILAKMVESAERAGVGLKDAARARFNEIQAQLAKLGSDFHNAVIDATAAFSYEKDGKKYTIDDAAYVETMKHCADREVRERLCRARATRAPENAARINEILKLRAEQAKLLGFADYAALSLSAKCAPSAKAVFDMIDRLDAATKKIADREEEELKKEFAASCGQTEDGLATAGAASSHGQTAAQGQAATDGRASCCGQTEDGLATAGAASSHGQTAAQGQAASSHGQTAAQGQAATDGRASCCGQTEDGLATRPSGPTPMPWDQSYCAEKLRERLYAYSEDELKQYLELSDVIKGLFTMTNVLFGVTVEEVVGDEKPSVWHPDVRFFRVKEGDRTIAHFYFDPFVRSGQKSGGAWMNEFRNLCYRAGTGGAELPLAVIVTNFPLRGKDGRCLLPFRDVETVFHEFGHALQQMLTRVTEEDAAGINLVEWDAVEVASQFMENWCLNDRTGLTVPAELKAKVRAAKNFRAATACRRQLAFAKTDMLLHTGAPTDDPDRVKTEQFAHFGMPSVEGDKFLCAFGHIFAGGYAAGYYGYKWAEVMSADCYGAFEEAGLSDDAAVRRLGRKYRETILALGGSKSALDVFRAFRGRDPEIAALLRQQGMAQ